ncbi:MAG: hypothetical protein IJG87_03325 [Ruminococcus sp.]|nr:hypothetical protein [Ruminococcus sp.]
MANKETEPPKGELLDRKDDAPDNAIKDRKTVFTAKRLETVVAILLGVTTLLSAWASWIGHLHGGIQSINFTKSNSMASQGTAEYNLGMQLYLADYMAWNTAKDYYYELEQAKIDGDQAKTDLINEKIKLFEEQNASEILSEGVTWMEENNEDNPFKMPGMAEKYFETAQEDFDQSQELLEEGKRDNSKGDSYLLVTVIYSLTLFLLGIVNTFKDMKNKKVVLTIAIVFLVFGFIYMCTIPLPTGFENMNFFEFNK